MLDLASLAVHYVEYHVIMAPRVFREPIAAGDRALAVALGLQRPLRVPMSIWKFSDPYFRKQLGPLYS